MGCDGETNESHCDGSLHECTLESIGAGTGLTSRLHGRNFFPSVSYSSPPFVPFNQAGISIHPFLASVLYLILPFCDILLGGFRMMECSQMVFISKALQELPYE